MSPYRGVHSGSPTATANSLYEWTTTKHDAGAGTVALPRTPNMAGNKTNTDHPASTFVLDPESIDFRVIRVAADAIRHSAATPNHATATMVT